MSAKRLDREFFQGDTLETARNLLGCVLVRETCEGAASGIIVETEAYLGERDAAAHSYKGRTGRNAVMYGPGGFAYVYMIYGIHHCFNVVTGPAGLPEAVLIRALEPLSGVSLMSERRGTDKPSKLCSGPGKLCAALRIDRGLNGADLLGGTIYIEPRIRVVGAGDIVSSKRIGISYAGDAANYPWRFLLRDSEFISVKP